MKLEELIAKVERFEQSAYIAAQKASDLRVLIVGLYDQVDWWKEKYMNLLAEVPEKDYLDELTDS